VQRQKDILWIALLRSCCSHMNNSRGISKFSVGQFTFFSILLQLLPFIIFLLFYGFNNCLSYGRHNMCSIGEGLDYRDELIPYINYFFFFGIIILNSVQYTTKSELLTSVMNVAFIALLWSETRDSFLSMPVAHIAFTLCIVLTVPIRILLFEKYHRAKKIV